MGKKRDHWVRHVMNLETERLVNALNPSQLSAVEISGKGWSSFGFQSWEQLVYPDFDITYSTIEPGRADIILADQVWEHLTDPERAMRNVFASLSPGGYFLNNTPFLLRYHECPIDCTRWTMTGMSNMMQRAGFEVVETGQWGNLSALIENMSSWPNYDPSKHSLENDPNYPIMVWALARVPC